VDWKGHLITASLLWWLVFIVLWRQGLALWLPLGGLPIFLTYSILPDLDIATSKAYRWSSRLGSLTGVFALTVGCLLLEWRLVGVGILVLLLFFILSFVRHKMFHKARFAILFSLPLLILGWQFFLVGVGGYMVHILSD